MKPWYAPVPPQLRNAERVRQGQPLLFDGLSGRRSPHGGGSRAVRTGGAGPDQAERRTSNITQSGAPIVESSSDTLGLGLALAGMAHGYRATVVADSGLEPSVRRALISYGVQVETVTRAHPVGGRQRARLDKAADLLAARPGAWCPDQLQDTLAMGHGPGWCIRDGAAENSYQAGRGSRL